MLVQTFTAHGFGPSCAWYTNDDSNITYAREAPHDGHLSPPVLFVNGEWDAVCTITGNNQGDPMRVACANLTVTGILAGHWLPLQRKSELVQAIRSWLQSNNL